MFQTFSFPFDFHEYLKPLQNKKSWSLKASILLLASLGPLEGHNNITIHTKSLTNGIHNLLHTLH